MNKIIFSRAHGSSPMPILRPACCHPGPQREDNSYSFCLSAELTSYSEHDLSFPSVFSSSHVVHQSSVPY